MNLATTANSPNATPSKAPKRHLTGNELLAIGSAFVAVATGSLLIGKNSKPEAPPYTDNVTHIVKSGDTLSGIADETIVKENASHDPRGRIELNPEQAATYLHTELNPAVGTVQNPHDGILQVGERVVGNIPLNTTKPAEPGK